MCSTLDKRAPGSMNDFAWPAEVLMAERHLHIKDVLDHLNECPLGYLGMDSPKLAVERLLGGFD
jgi:hypothetical protein